MSYSVHPRILEEAVVKTREIDRAVQTTPLVEVNQSCRSGPNRYTTHTSYTSEPTNVLGF